MDKYAIIYAFKKLENYIRDGFLLYRPRKRRLTSGTAYTAETSSISEVPVRRGVVDETTRGRLAKRTKGRRTRIIFEVDDSLAPFSRKSAAYMRA